MKPLFSINELYTTHLSKGEVNDILKSLVSNNGNDMARHDKFQSEISEYGFNIDATTLGLDGFTLEQYPAIEGVYYVDNPLTINLIIKPSYSMILFFPVFVFTFIPAAILLDKITINGVLREPTHNERFLFSLGGLIPGILCYFGHIRPVRKANKWIVTKLSLTPTINFGS